ncbi:arginine ABC transporter permease ArtQ [Candidatus Schmidhempelia bombi]|uniref:Arginine ABC transporter permease ArtQ n=1 Tax=Candidatus Schmidhempelia bombi str. Bimp TaxID=1387197 RepID=A0AB94IBM7_9GAMM|nr:arginine ABC transporter permease ArtQ [Candidatus Schmidhempelia bombi]TEA26809.1 arginine ABC transporter permease ArtQ [Candidatus Schmidhempelia bombi str. Bimp]
MSQWFLDSSFTLLLKASGVTLYLALSSLLLGLLLALVFAVLEANSFRWVAKTTTLLVMIIRGLPEILVVIAIYNGIPMILNAIADGFTMHLFITDITIQHNIENFDISPIICGIIALSLLYASYASQTLRGAFKAISPGQRQAAQVLGLSKARILWRIELPQLWRHALPGLGNQWLVLLKDTALVSLITVNDIMMQTLSIISYTKQPFSGYLMAASLYLLISVISQWFLKKLEKKSLYFEQGASYAR